MALRNLVEGECGAANPLVQWSSHFAQEKSLLKVGLNHDRLSDITKHGHVTEEQLVDEFLGPGQQQQRPAVPQTYNMASLLEELHMTQQAPPPSARLHPQTTHHDDVRVKEWVQEFAPPQATPMAPPTTSANEWAHEFQREHPPTVTESEWVKEFAPTPDEKWVEEFENQYPSTSGGRGLAAVAKEMTETVTDPELKETEFMDFVKKLSTGEAAFDENQEVVMSKEDWSEEFEKEVAANTNGGYWDRLEKEWQDLARQEEPHPWLSEFEATPSQYKFQENNPLLDVAQPLEEGLKKLQEGDLPSAVLLFEAEVRARPDSVRGWQLLGSTQADNEQDQAAIAALLKCLELDTSNLPAHMSLAVCYTNESQQSKVQQFPLLAFPALQASLRSITTYPASRGKALDALCSWIAHNPKYSSLVPSEASAKTTPPHTSSFMTPEEHAKVKDLFLAAAQMSPDSVDCDVQVGLGVLFNLSNEYDKAVDCFTAGLNIKPDDAMLWNKLGATLANSSRSEEAVAAYRKALELMPGFTRSRYNLGVSCINLGAYKEAVEHFLTALNLQQHAKVPPGSGGLANRNQMSEGIWSTLRLAISLMGRPELHTAVQNRDLESLTKEFGID